MAHTVTRRQHGTSKAHSRLCAASIRVTVLLAALCLCAAAQLSSMARVVAGQVAVTESLKAEVTHVDISKFPQVRVYVSVSDAGGGQIDDNLPARLRLFENDRFVAEKTLSGGHRVFTVLVIDTSLSMAGDKLAKAKEAAISFIRAAPPNFQTACVRFGTAASVISQFGERRETTRDIIDSLVAGGTTALQDGVGQALDMLKERDGRKVVVLLTDGQENSSTAYTKQGDGLERLIERGRREGSSIFTVGLGGDVDEAYLRRYEPTGGAYLFSPSPDELRSVFRKIAGQLEREHVVEYTSPAREFDGSVRNFRAELQVGEEKTMSEDVSLPIFGVIPNVPARLTPYALAFLTLLLLPPLVGLARTLYAIHAFRASSVERLGHGSRLIGRADLNGKVLVPGDVVVVCPVRTCQKAHHVRSWRLNRCRCMNESGGEGHYCYTRLLPRSLRHALNNWMGEPESEDGRRWLCWCAGDEKGY
jgi:uncharacterized protein YegL